MFSTIKLPQQVNLEKDARDYLFRTTQEFEEFLLRASYSGSQIKPEQTGQVLTRIKSALAEAQFGL